MKLSKIAKSESGPGQLIKILLCLIMISCVITMNFLQPTDSYDSPLGITKCSVGYWGVIAGFLLACLVMTLVAYKINKSE